MLCWVTRHSLIRCVITLIKGLNMTMITATIRNRREFFYAYDLWSRGTSQVEIADKVAVTSRTVERWVNIFRTAPKEETVKDQPFRLINMNQYGMDWGDADSVITGRREYIKNGSMRWSGSYRNVPMPTGREVFWLFSLGKMQTFHPTSRPKGRTSPTQLLHNFVDKLVTYERETLFGQEPTVTEEKLNEELEELQGRLFV